MDRNEIFEKIMRLEMNVNQLSKETSELKALAVELVEENVALQLENDNLKKVLGNDEPTTIDTANSKPAKAVKKPLPSKDNWLYCMEKDFIFVKANYLENIDMVKIVCSV